MSANVVVNRLNRLYDASAERAFAAVLAQPAGPLLARQGRRPGGGLEVTVSGTPEAVRVAPGLGVITDVTRGGSFQVAVTAEESVNLAARPGAGTSRIDVVYLLVKNSDVIAGDGARDADVGVATGAASASPSAPGIPSGAMQIARLTVPASGAVVVSGLLPRIAALGGVLPVASQAERDAISPLYDGLLVFREDTGFFEGRVAGAWQQVVTANRSVKGTVTCVADGTALTPLTTLTYPAAFAALLGGATPLVTGLQVYAATGAGKYVAGVEQLTATSLKVAVRRLDGGVIANGTSIPVHYRLELP